MRWSGEKKETSIKQIEFKSFGKAGSQRVSTGNGRFMLHLYNHAASRCSLLTRARGCGGLALLPRLGGLGGCGGPAVTPLHTHTRMLCISARPPSSSSHVGGIPKRCRAVDLSPLLLPKPPKLWVPPPFLFIPRPGLPGALSKQPHAGAQLSALLASAEQLALPAQRR